MCQGTQHMSRCVSCSSSRLPFRRAWQGDPGKCCHTKAPPEPRTGAEEGGQDVGAEGEASTGVGVGGKGGSRQVARMWVEGRA